MTPLFVALIVCILANVLIAMISITVVVYVMKHVYVDVMKLKESEHIGAVNNLEHRLAQLQTMRFSSQRQVIIPERRVKK
jgi:hypothetical protein